MKIDDRQGDLLTHIPRHNGPAPTIATDTQLAALAAIDEMKGTRRGEVLSCIRDWTNARDVGGATDEDISRTVKRDIRSVAARRNELFAMGLVRDSGARRLGRLGNALIVWEIGADPEFELIAFRKNLIHLARKILAGRDDRASDLEGILVNFTAGEL
jgi:hypothetical protein